ncbi:GNAT family N-acetyltransferase [Rhodospirillum rubrum]|uniref:GNAT family N-acetyltransferase n=1 Tax=Rhodospirillum rubrum TaxID=1085 RepID=UPI0019075F6E|nr:GNAT family protein [Rhodospirillum rubrum]MBK1663443.1 GNAT family N-acetyltransferase [Rhodospirillum rubrum]MBK1675374.1 GNAT family N-acetyltransferase [Rhodospirillum rubrum]
MILTTGRLVLRPFRFSDATAIVAYASAPDFIRFLPIPLATPERAADFVAQRVREGQPDGLGDWHFVVQRQGGGAPVGAVRLGLRDEENRQGDVGYVLHPAARGQGLATEAVRGLLDFGFRLLGLERIWASADVDNRASWRVMERVGMRREGVSRHTMRVDGVWRDSVLYAVLAGDAAARALPKVVRLADGAVEDGAPVRIVG